MVYAVFPPVVYLAIDGGLILLVRADVEPGPGRRARAGHRRELNRFAGKAHEKGLTLVPLKLYFNERGIAKVQFGLCRGRKTHDKREHLKKADVKRDLQRAMRR